MNFYKKENCYLTTYGKFFVESLIDKGLNEDLALEMAHLTIPHEDLYSLDEEALNKKDDSLNRIEARLSKIEETLIRNTISLEEHIRRTEILEKEIIPLRRRSDFIDAAYKTLVGLLAILVAGKKLDLL